MKHEEIMLLADAYISLDKLQNFARACSEVCNGNNVRFDILSFTGGVTHPSPPPYCPRSVRQIKLQQPQASKSSSV